MVPSTSYSYTRVPSPPNEDLSGHPGFSVDKYVASPLPDDSAVVASMHYDEFGKFLVSCVPKANTPPIARQKLMRLSSQQFQELRTDVYDEIIRRQANLNTTQVPFLPPHAEFHPKRNQARMKLSTLAISRFQDLCRDVRFELGRRYPECKDSEEPSDNFVTTVSTYDNSPSSVGPNAPGDRARDWTAPNSFGSTSKNPPSGVAPTTLL